MKLDLIDAVFEYRWLVEKRGRLAIPLERAELTKYMELGLVLGADEDGVERRDSERAAQWLGVEVARARGFASSVLSDISANGCRVWMQDTMYLGEQVHVRIRHPERPVEYVFPCRVVWATPAPDAQIGLEFSGMPVRMQLRRVEPRAAFRNVA